MSKEALTEEDVFADDRDPLEAIREIRKQEGMEDDAIDAAISEAGPSPVEDVVPQEEPSPEEEDAAAADQEEIGQFKQEFEQQEEKKEGDSLASQEQEEGQEAASAETQAKTATEAKKHVFKARGQEYEFTEEEIMEQFPTVFGKAVDYTQKLQEIAPYRKMISALETEGISAEQLNVAIDALKGNKDALSFLMKEHQIDSLDLDPEEAQYQPNVYGKDEAQLAIEDVTRIISQDKEAYPLTVDVIDNQWDSASRRTFAGNPDLILGLHNDIKNGVFDKVMPRANKMRVLDGSAKSYIEYYILAGQQLQAEEAQNQGRQEVDKLNQKAQDAATEYDNASSEARRKRAASSTGTRADRKGVIDYLDDDDDEAFNAWYQNLERSH